MNSDLFRDAIESYYLETREGLFFAIKGHEHPPDRFIAVLRYAPDREHGDRTRRGVSYRRLYHFGEQEQLLRSAYPQYLAYDPVFQATLQSVPRPLIRQICDPCLRLHQIARASSPGPLEQDVAAFASLLQAEAEVPLSAVGISGSLLIEMHTEQSDLDLSIFGAESCRKVHAALTRLLDAQSMPALRRLDRNGLEELYRQRVADTRMAADDFRFAEKNKVNQGFFRSRPYFTRFIKRHYEASESYGTVRYEPLGRAAIEATVADDRDAIFTPCKYSLTDVRVVEGRPLPVSEIVSFRGRFCEQAKTGDVVKAAGTLERIDRSHGDTRYRLLLGNSPGDAMIVCL